MIIRCKICGGKGLTHAGGPFENIFGEDRMPCPSCKGAGEFDLKVPQEKLTTCKFCAGRGLVISPGFGLFAPTGTLCPTCKGLGVLERPQIGVNNLNRAKPETTRASRPLDIEYDLAISFAGEDRSVVRPYAEAIMSEGLKIFYADFEEVALWGTNLYETFDVIYRLKAHYCVVFLSQHYAAKVWTNHERRAAQARALMENREYILPVRLDNTEIPGLAATIGYLDFDKVGHEGLVKATLEKLSRYKSKKIG